ncbi:MAG TPA: caspase family protein [Bacteroidales bacterium]|nr:caspase family protein [Bacteroidales bacterium]
MALTCPDGGDETGYIKALCPYDCANNLITIEEVYDIFEDLVKGVHLTIFLDTSFSGTVTRACVSEFIPGLRTPDDRRVRFLSPALMGNPVLQNPWKAKPKEKTKYQESKMKEVLLSGCTDKEYSYDALIDGVYHGAMTYFALKIVREANCKITYAQLGSRLIYLLDDAGYPQHPQLLARNVDKKRLVFT